METNLTDSLSEHGPADNLSAKGEPASESAPKRPVFSRIVLAGAAMGLLANLLFYERMPGISVFIFVLAGLTALFLIGQYAGVPVTWRGAWPAVPLVFLSAMAGVRAAPILSLLNIAACLVLLIALAHTYPGHNVLSFGFLGYVARGISGAVEIVFLRPAQALDRALGERHTNNQPPCRTTAVLRGLVIAVPVLVVFTLLFSAADVVFERMVDQAFRWLDMENLPEFVIRLMFTIFAGWVVAGGLAYAIRGLAGSGDPKPGERKGRLGVVEAAVVLGSVNALFGLFVAVQVRYFFGGQANISVEGFTYSEYARRGFAELVAVAILTLGLVFAAQSLTVRSSRREALGFEALAALLVGLTGIILVSAFQRMRLYEEAYGLTQLRFLVYVFIAWLAVLLFVSLLTLHYDRPRWFATAVFVASLGYAASLNILNMDAFIARQNLARFTAGDSFATGGDGRSEQTVDASYLATLSDDAVPVLLSAYAHLPAEGMEILGSALHLRLDELDALAESDGWPQPGGTGWNYARWQAWVLLKAAGPGLENFEPKRPYWVPPF